MDDDINISRDQLGTRIFLYIILMLWPFVIPGIDSWWDHALGLINTLVTMVFPLEWFWRQNRKPKRERDDIINTPKPIIRVLGYLFIVIYVGDELHERIDFFVAMMATIVLTTELIIMLRKKLNRPGFLSRFLIVVLISFNGAIFGILIQAVNTSISAEYIPKLLLTALTFFFIVVLVVSELVQRYWIMAARRFGDQGS